MPPQFETTISEGLYYQKPAVGHSKTSIFPSKVKALLEPQDIFKKQLMSFYLARQITLQVGIVIVRIDREYKHQNLDTEIPQHIKYTFAISIRV
jgi:hypothetical protein